MSIEYFEQQRRRTQAASLVTTDSSSIARVSVIVGVLRLAIAALIVVAIVAQFMKSLSLVAVPGVFVMNFLSFFTIQSNLLGAVVLTLAALKSFRSSSFSERFTALRAFSTTYLVTTLVVYNLLLRNISLDQTATVPWSNEILHLWAPLLVLLDWIFTPWQKSLSWRLLWIAAIYPIAWSVYTMLRGSGTGWYPYPFLDPNVAPGIGYEGVLVYVIAIAGFIVVTGSGIFALSRIRLPGMSKIERGRERIAQNA